MKGLIFDLDGTLLDSMPSWQQQLNDCLLSRGITPPDDLLDRTKTLGLESATGMVLKEFNLPDDPAEVYHSFQVNMEKLYCSKIPLKEGVYDFLKEMSAKGAPMAVATATSKDLVEKVLAFHHLTDLFQCVTTVAEVGIGKHDPKVFVETAKKMNLTPEDCVVFEDSLKAILSANRAHFKTVGIYEETNPTEQDAIQKEATLFIHNFKELLNR